MSLKMTRKALLAAAPCALVPPLAALADGYTKLWVIYDPAAKK